MAEGAPKPPDAVGNRKNMRRMNSEQKKAGPYQKDKQPFLFAGSPFDKEKEAELYHAHEVAQRILHNARPDIPDVHIPDDADQSTKERLEKDRATYAYARDRNAQLTEAFEQQRKEKKKEDQDDEARGKAMSEILEAMVLVGSKKMFGEDAAVLPTEYSDRVDGADVVVTLKKGVAFVIDAATDQDIYGYAPPAWAKEGTPKEKGLEEKLKKSYHILARARGTMSHVRYVDTGGGTVGAKTNMPRVIVALSQDAIKAIAADWAKDPATFDYAGNTYTKQIQHSVAAQLVAQLRFARAEQKRDKKYIDAQGKEKTPVHQEEKYLRNVIHVLHKKVPIHTDTAQPEAITDPVLRAVHDTVTNTTKRQKIMADARREQLEHEQKKSGYTQDTEPGGDMLTAEERDTLEAHIAKRDPEKQSEVMDALYNFLTDPKKLFPAALLSVVAGGVSLYLYNRLKKAAEEKGREQILPQPNSLVAGAAAAVAGALGVAARTSDTQEPIQKASRGPHAALPFENIVPIGGGKSEHVAQLPIAGLSAHMVAVDKLRESLKGNPFEKKSTRWWSRMKNFALHKLTSVFGVGTGLLAKWVVCGLGAGTLGALGAGIMAGGIAAFGAWKYLKKKKWYDDPWVRERAGATQAVFNDISNNPATLGYLLTNEAARNAEIERRTKRRIRVGQATLALTNAATAGAALHVATGGEFLPAALRDARTGTLHNTLSLFACNEPGWFSSDAPLAAGGYEVSPPSGVVAQGGETFIPLTEESPTARPIATAQYETIEPKNPWDSANHYDPTNPWAEWQKRQIPAASYDCHIRACDAQLRLDNIQSRPDATGEWRITDQLDPYGGRWRPEDMDVTGGYYRDALGYVQPIGNNQVRSYTWDLGR